MRLPSRMEIRLDAEVKPKPAATKPHTASLREVRGLLLFGQSEHVHVERSRFRFLASGHRELDVMEIDDFGHESIIDRVAAQPARSRGKAAIDPTCGPRA